MPSLIRRRSAGATFSPTPARTLSERAAPSSTGTLTKFAKSLASAGDIDKDGDEELLIGEPNYDRKGRVLVFRGSPTGVAAEPAWSMSGANGGDFGDAIGSGDIDGDGRSDVIVGEPSYDAPSGGGTADSAGRVHLVRGRSITLR